MDIPHRAKTDYYDYYDAQVTRPLPEPGTIAPGLAADFAFTRAHTDQAGQVLLHRPVLAVAADPRQAYADPADLVRALARWLNSQAAELADAGAELLQIDEPFLAGYPEAAELAVEAVNTVTAGVRATWALHVCYGNRYARPLWEGHYDFLFPAVLSARVDQLVLEFARKGPDDLRLFRQYPWNRGVGSRRHRREERRGGDPPTWSPRGSAARWSSCPLIS